MNNKMTIPEKIAVLMGGPGSERDVSLATGRGIAKALRSLGADVVDVDVRDAKFELPDDVDLAFNALVRCSKFSKRGALLTPAKELKRAGWLSIKSGRKRNSASMV